MQTTHDVTGERAGWMPRLESIGARFKAAREMLDLREQIIRHPWRAVGVALLFGAWVGLEAPKSSPDDPSTRSRVAGALLTTAGAIAMRVLREIALKQASTAAKQWYDTATANAARRDPSAVS